MADLRARVAQRRADGAYPPGLEHELDVHFRHIVEHRPVRNLDALRRAMEAFEEGLRFDARQIPVESSVPGGALLHKGLGKLTTRQTDWMVERMREFAESVRVMLWKMIETLDAPTHVHADLTAQVDAVLDRIAAYEQYPADAPALGAIVARLEALEAAEAARAQPAPPAQVPPGAPAGDAAEGALSTRLAGLDPLVRLGPGVLAELAGAAPGSLGAVVLSGATDLAQVTDVAALAADRLRPGGALGLLPSALHPAHLTFILREAGFREVALLGDGPHPALLATR